MDIWKHVAGTKNKWADALSRLHEPDAGFVVPQELCNVEESTVGTRVRLWWEAAQFQAGW